MQQLFYERRQREVSISYPDRRKKERRKGHQSDLVDNQKVQSSNCIEAIHPEKRRLASQIRRYEREIFKIPVHLKIEKKEISGYTHDISPEGLLIYSDAILTLGTPLSLQFSFGENLCYLNISGQVVFCRKAENNDSSVYTMGIRFSAIREFERKILISAVQELRESTQRYEKSILTIDLSLDNLAQEVANLKDGYLKKFVESKAKGSYKSQVEVLKDSIVKESFRFNKILYLTDTNLHGKAYFAKYFEWQGMAREEFFRRVASDPLAFFRSGLRIITLAATMEYKSELDLYDEIEIEVRTGNIRKASFELFFYFFNKRTSSLVAKGSQRLVFVGNDGEIIPIPAEIKRRGYAFLDDNVTRKAASDVKL